MKLDKGTPSNLIKDIMKNIFTKNDAFVRLVTIIFLILLTKGNHLGVYNKSPQDLAMFIQNIAERFSCFRIFYGNPKAIPLKSKARRAKADNLEIARRKKRRLEVKEGGSSEVRAESLEGNNLSE